MHTFKIHAPFNPGKTVVELDGKRIDGVTRVEFSIVANRPVEVSLTVMGYVDITGEFSESELVRVRRPSDEPAV